MIRTAQGGACDTGIVTPRSTDDWARRLSGRGVRLHYDSMRFRHLQDKSTMAILVVRDRHPSADEATSVGGSSLWKWRGDRSIRSGGLARWGMQALLIGIAACCSAGCASPQRVAVADSESLDPAPNHRSTAATKALDVQTAQMAEEDQRRAAQAYERVPIRNRRFRDEPIRSKPRP